MITYDTRAESHEQVDKALRYLQILETLQDKEMTAKEIAVEMCKKGYIPTDERNFTAPRLTELSIKGIVEPIGKKTCKYTGKTVSVYKIREKMTKEEKKVYEYITELEPYCQICGSPYQLHRHHIRYGAEGRKTYIGNIIVLCERCHRMVHSNKKHWQPKLIELDEKIRNSYKEEEK